MGGGTDTDVYAGALQGQPVAVKVLRATRSPEAEYAFRQEVRMFMELKLEHPNVVRAYGWGVRAEGGEEFLVLERLGGGTLRRALTKRLYKDLRRVVQLARDVAAALAYLHSRGVIYRDLKSSNVLLNEDWTRAVVCDFGIAKLAVGDEAGQMTRECGTYQYMSPEVILGKSDYDAKADVYSFGILLNEMCTGEVPFSRQHLLPVQAAAGVVNKGLRPGMRASVGRKYPELHALIRKCWAQRDIARPDVAEVCRELRAILDKYFVE